MTNAVLDNRSDWRAVWRLIKPYWVSDDRWAGRGLLFAIVSLSLAMVYLDVQFNDWNRAFYNALETKNYDAFRSELWRFSYLAFIYIAVAVYRLYMRQALEIRWRGWMTQQYMKRWLANQAYYRLEQSRRTDNPDQRIAEDLRLLTNGTLLLSLGFLSSVVSLVTFIGILWSVSGPISFMLAGYHWHIPAYMVWFAIAYAFIGSALVFWIGRRLVPQNFDLQRFEADFRFGLIRIRENAESVALYRGEEEEQAQLTGRFEKIQATWWDIMRTTKRLTFTQNSYNQFAIIFPFLVGAPRYFSGSITLGGLMQISSAFGHVQESLSWFIDAFDNLAHWKASVNRLAGFHAAVEDATLARPGIVAERNNVGAILLENLALHTPDGNVLTEAVSADIRYGDRILVTGPSGCGKSTLFRAIAGIWPYGAGMVEIPREAKLLFLPQKSYLPIASLRAAITYPAPESAFKDLAIRHYLELCKLPHLAGRLDEVDNWSQRLSPGEQQRLAFVRVLLIRPDILFLDEASSALDAGTEDVLYQLVLQELQDVALISIAHREAVAKYHQIRWQFTPSDVAADKIEASAPALRYRIERARIAK